VRNDWFCIIKRAPLFVLLFSAVACSSLGEKKKKTVSQKSPVGRQLQCMADAIHGEARGEDDLGKIFVGRVIMTRVKEGYGPNYCSVVHAKRQFAPKQSNSAAARKAAVEAEKLGPNGVTHFHSYKKQKTRLAGFSRSRNCVTKRKIGGHWGFYCHEARNNLKRTVASDDE